MSRLIAFIVVAAVGTTSFFYFNNNKDSTSSFQLAAVKASGGLISSQNDQMLAINSAGHIYGFGSNVHHELGLVNIETIPIPKLVSDITRWRYVSLGSNVSLAIDQNGELWRRPFLTNMLYTKDNNVYYDVVATKRYTDELTELGKLIPYLPVDSNLHFRKATEQGGLAVALDEGGKLWGWRENKESFASEFPSRLNEPAPERFEILPVQKWRDFCLSNYALLAIDEQGVLWRLFGEELVYKHRLSGSVEIELDKVNSRAPPAERVFCSNSKTVILQDGSGELWGYGSNSYGELGISRSSHPSDEVDDVSHLALGNYSEIAIGSGYTLAIHRDGSLWAWGLNTSGQLGVGEKISGTDKPHLVDRSRTWIAITASHDTSAGMTSQGELYTWGRNRKGSLGEGGSTSIRYLPLPVFDNQKWGGVSQ